MLLAFATLLQAADIQAFHKAFGPKSTIRVSSPTVEWEVWAGEGAHVTSASMSLNGHQVEASYNARRKILAYTPSAPLQAGTYSVDCKVVVDNQLVVTKDWSFEVAREAQAYLPSPSDGQIATLQAVNAYRQILSLPPMQMDARLNAAAFSHSSYLAANRRGGHFEKEGEPKFAGRDPSSRLESFGYLGGSWECVSSGIYGVGESIRQLFDAPYHRLPFMQPGFVCVGTGYTDERMTLNFGVSDQVGAVVSPADGQWDVPIGWRAVETPNPLRLHNPTGPVGYPLMLAEFGAAKIVVRSAGLWAGNDVVPVFVNTPATDDDLQNAVILIPTKPLRPQTAYIVSVVYSTGGGDITKTWSFRTGASPQSPPQHQQ